MAKEIEINVPTEIAVGKIVAIVARCAAEFGLLITMRGTLKAFADSMHWHLKKDGGRGTLEITWWPRRRRLWIKIQSGRAAEWIGEIAPRFKTAIESRLSRTQK